MIWISYLPGREESIRDYYYYFFFFCDSTNMEVDISKRSFIANNGSERSTEFLDETKYNSFNRWKESFGYKDNSIIIPTDIKKLPKSVEQFKKLCKELLPEVFL